MTIVTAARPIPNLTIPPIETSLVSWPASVMSQRLLELGVVQRQERPLAELPRKDGEPEPADSDRSENVHPVEPEAVPGERRLRQPEDLHQLHENDEPRDRREDARIAVGGRGQEHQEGKDEVEEQDRDGDPAPASLQAAQVPGDLLRQVSGPDNQVLRERDVS